MRLRRPFTCKKQPNEVRCGPGNLLSGCICFAFFMEMFISFSQPLPTTRVIEFQKGPAVLYRELSDTSGVYKNSSEYPRIFDVARELRAVQNSNRVRRSVAPMSTSECDYCQEEMNSHIFPFEKPYYDQCTPMAEWQATFHETCNNLHEFDLASDDIALLSTQGSWRTVWKMELPQNKSAILKLLRMEARNFTHEAYAYHRTDANVMSQLTASPYVVNAYSFCGQSVATEFASSGARNFVKDSRFSSLERLEMGRDLARALAALHSIDYPNSINATLAHNDINMANAVQVDGQLKLNDFNIAIVMKWNKTQPCNSPVRFAAPLWKSPEEVRNSSYIDPSLADVYGLGNLLFQVMSKHQPWTHLEPGGQLDKEEVAERKMRGILPHVPDKHKWSNKTAIQALYFGTMACFRYEPQERLTSYELSRAFDLVLKAIQKQLKLPRETVSSVSQRTLEASASKHRKLSDLFFEPLQFFEKEFWYNMTQKKQQRSTIRGSKE